MGPDDISARLGMLVEGGRPGKCSAMRNICDWLYVVRGNCLDGKKQEDGPGVGLGAMQDKGPEMLPQDRVGVSILCAGPG